MQVTLFSHLLTDSYSFPMMLAFTAAKNITFGIFVIKNK